MSVYIPQRKLHLNHYDLPLALIKPDGSLAWRAEYDEWGNMLREDNPENLSQLMCLPGQQYDEETGLYYNRHRYYDPQQGRYITQDPIGLAGGWNKYVYPLSPIRKVAPYGLQPFNGIDLGRATTERASLGLWMTQNEEAPDVIAKVMAPLYSSSPLSRECRVSGILSAGTGLSGGGAYNERNGT